MHIESRSIDAAKAISVSVAESKILPALFAAVIGLALIFAAGFAETSVLHSATHDARHSAGFPCH